jgi:LysR family nitrogen assimilation transcriptional regulator
VLFDDGQLGGFEATPLVEEDLMYICRADSNWAAGGVDHARRGPGQHADPARPAARRAPLIEQVAGGAGLALTN